MLAVVLAGLACGVLDILAAFLVYNGTPQRILQSIAFGALGRPTYSMGWNSALLGLAFHICIAFGAAAAYWIASQRLRILVRRPWIFGPIHGVAVYFFMQLVVIPLSKIGPRPLSGVGTGLAIHILCVGLPIALVISWDSCKRGRSTSELRSSS